MEITTRKIRKGTYDISGFFFFGGADKSNALSVYVDDDYLGVIDLTEPAWGGPPIRFGTVTFTETKEHKIRLETTSPGQCFWDYVRFTPH